MEPKYSKMDEIDLRDLAESLTPKENLKEKPYVCDQCQGNIIIDSGMFVCKECGCVEGYMTVPYFSCKKRRVSKYISKYHVHKKLDGLAMQLGISIPVYVREIVIYLVKKLRENKKGIRVISINYIISRIFEMVGISCDDIPSIKTKGCRLRCENAWDQIMNSKTGDEIRRRLKNA